MSLVGFTLGFLVSPTIKNMCHGVMTQSASLAKSTDEDLDPVPGCCTAAARCSSEEDEFKCRETHFTVRHVYVTNKVSPPSSSSANLFHKPTSLQRPSTWSEAALPGELSNF